MTPRERAIARDLADRLTVAFSWQNTPQGLEYWGGVWNNLRKLAEDPKELP